MLSESIKKQEIVIRILKSHMAQNRLSHSYLMTGDCLPVKEELAQSFAATLNCLSGKMFESCDCESCHKVMTAQHPDVRLLGEDEKARSIKIEEIRDTLSAVSLKPYEGKWKVCLIKNAERLTTESSNALLKTLEEPPKQTLFILLTTHKENLLETIQSRCFVLRFKPMTDEASKALKEDFWGGQKPEELFWEDFFVSYEKLKREELVLQFGELAMGFRDRLEKAASETDQLAFVKAIEYTLETKEAVGANVNQKLALSRLAMQLSKIFSKIPISSAPELGGRND